LVTLTSTSVEVERKYETPSDFTLPDLTGVPGVAAMGDTAEFDLDATYYDTDDLRLARNRLTLRRRRGGHDAGWHLKRPAEAGSRREIQAPDADELPADLAAETRVVVRDRPLRPVVRLRTTRRETPLLDGAGRMLAHVAEDEVEAERIGAGRQCWREVEVELADGDPELLDAVERVLVEAGARPAALPSKLVRALGDEAPGAEGDAAPGPDGEPADEAGEGAGKAGTGPGRLLVGYLRAQRDEIMRTDPLVRAQDPDGVHDMRVATRRLRSTLRTFRSALGDAEHLRDELRWIALLLGAVRDGDVLADELIRDISGAAPDMVPGVVTQRIRRRLGEDAGRARAELAEAMESPRYFAILDELDRQVECDDPTVTAKALRKRVRNRLAKADNGIEAVMRVGLVAPSDERDHELHEARKSYKKARYAVEVIAPDHGRKAARLIARLKALQDLLGEHQDAVVAAVLLRQLGAEAHEAGESEFGFGVLCEQQTERAAARRAEVPAAYRRASSKKARGWL
jgi:CHAD domain-containing protein